MISTAILLAAGEGSRLRSAAPLKPLCTVAGRSLIGHALEGLAAAGLMRAVVVLGYGANEIAGHIAARPWPLAVETVTNEDYRSPNGTSVLAAQPLIGTEEALLAMCDHLVEPADKRQGEFPIPVRDLIRSVAVSLDGSKAARVFGLRLPPWRSSLERCLDEIAEARAEAQA